MAVTSSFSVPGNRTKGVVGKEFPHISEEEHRETRRCLEAQPRRASSEIPRGGTMKYMRGMTSWQAQLIMNMEAIDNLLGKYEARQQKTMELAVELADFLINNEYDVLGPLEIGEDVQAPDDDLENFVQIEYRAKTSDSILNKLNRFGEQISEIMDLYGLRLVVKDTAMLDECAKAIKNGLWNEPSTEQMTIRGGKMWFSPFRDYRKRDWEGASPLSAGGYDEAIHVNRKTQNGIVEIQIMTRNLYGRYYGDGDESHKNFKAKQSAFYAK